MNRAENTVPPCWYEIFAMLARRGSQGLSEEAIHSETGRLPRPGRYELGGMFLELIHRDNRFFLGGAPPALSVDEVRRHLGPGWSSVPVRVHTVCESTNAALLKEAEAIAPEGSARSSEGTRRSLPLGSAVAAETQTKGRGRWGRSWCSPPFVGLWFSLWCPKRRGLCVYHIAPAASAGVVRALESFGVTGVSILWPNDIAVEEGKAGGILVEEGKEGWAVGVGLNTSGMPSRFVDTERGRPPPVSVGLNGAMAPERSKLLAACLVEIVRSLEYTEGSVWRQRLSFWKKKQSILGRKVLLKLKGRSVEGVVRELDPARGILLSGQPRWFVPYEVFRVEKRHKL